VQLERNDKSEAVPGLMELENGSTTPTTLVPFHAGEPLNWRLNRAQWH